MSSASQGYFTYENKSIRASRAGILNIRTEVDAYCYRPCPLYLNARQGSLNLQAPEQFTIVCGFRVI